MRFYQMRTPQLIEGLLDMIKYMGDTKDMSMIEIGSYTGESTRVFAKHFERVLSIDPYINDYDPTALVAKHAHFDDVYAEFLKNIASYPNISHMRQTSDEAIKTLSAPFDFVYIDGMHSFEQVTKDIENYLPLIKKGFIGGHDYSSHWTGVISAVDSKFGKPDKVFKDTSWIKRIV